ncbi:hypothetical protein GLYMA_06G295900v4 [Glycine max]|uniref:Uncharacterized protein n=1 Tax=Glycine max TaxID=3847 RepID=I1KF41_SOYBN|nr:hypothetical protein GYH30_016628 [Glycine max]KRH56004.1 hypothetical protein GLYMA_06G295900v4 [Glycine max]
MTHLICLIYLKCSCLHVQTLLNVISPILYNIGLNTKIIFIIFYIRFQIRVS